MYNQKIEILKKKIEEYLLPYQEYVEKLLTISGISNDSAAAIISEFSIDMKQFPQPEKLNIMGRAMSW